MADNNDSLLPSEPEALSSEGIAPYLSDAVRAAAIHVYPVLESTNNTAKELAADGCPHGTAVLADTQTGGRGRQGRRFYSPAGSGLYFSIVLYPRLLSLDDIASLTAGAAVIACRAIKAVTSAEAEIKWVNDIYLDGKKVCGILTEAGPISESSSPEWVVIGIGINLTTRNFPEELQAKAGSVLSEDAGASSHTAALRCRLAGELINRLLAPGALSDNSVFTEYRERLMLLGRTVTVHSSGGDYAAVVRGLERDYRLVVEKADGSVERLSFGEVSLRI